MTIQEDLFQKLTDDLLVLLYRSINLHEAGDLPLYVFLSNALNALSRATAAVVHMTLADGKASPDLYHRVTGLQATMTMAHLKSCQKFLEKEAADARH